MELLAISMDGVSNAANMAATTGATFPILADPEGAATRDYGVFDLLGDGLAAPATFIVARDGTILWRHVGHDIAERPSASEVLRRVSELVD